MVTTQCILFGALQHFWFSVSFWTPLLGRSLLNSYFTCYHYSLRVNPTWLSGGRKEVSPHGLRIRLSQMYPIWRGFEYNLIESYTPQSTCMFAKLCLLESSKYQTYTLFWVGNFISFWNKILYFPHVLTTLYWRHSCHSTYNYVSILIISCF